eukprot:611020-Pelagomonas_calceolata.AAC.1
MKSKQCALNVHQPTMSPLRGTRQCPSHSVDVNAPPCQIWYPSAAILLTESSFKISSEALLGHALPPWTLAAQI